MCGITGVFSSGVISGERFYDAHRTLEHRGPDDEGFVSFDTNGKTIHLKGERSVRECNHLPSIENAECHGILLGHHRLAIVDRSSKSHQPMMHGDIVISYNGMLYNYQEIRSELEQLGHSFSSDGDTEVVLKAFCQWGKFCFPKFNGMWAIATFDNKNNILTLARDRFGIKPLYYTTKKSDLCFASEIKFITNYLGSRKLNSRIAFDYVRYGLLDHSEQTFFDGIYSIKPGTVFEYNLSKISEEQFYNFDQAKHTNLNCDTRSVLTTSIREQLVSEKPVGALLSGGIDSSLIVAIAATDLGTRLDTFSVDFDEKEYSERDLVEKTLEMQGLDGTFVNLSEKEMLGALKKVLWHRESPIRSLATVSQFLLFKEIENRSDISVVLTGDGSDELFLGYQNDIYIYLESLLFFGNFRKFFEIADKYKKLQEISWPTIMGKFAVYIASRLIRYKSFYRKAGFSMNKLPEGFENKTSRNIIDHKLSSIFFSPLPEYLTSIDRMAMSKSIETRVPFLDNSLVEMAIKGKQKNLFVDGYSKTDLRKIADCILPAEIARCRKKMGFQTPQTFWQRNNTLKKNINKRLKKLFSNRKYTFLDNEYLSTKSKHTEPTEFLDPYTAWRIYCLENFVSLWQLNDE